jgi:Flp pilus assembly protein TadD
MSRLRTYLKCAVASLAASLVFLTCASAEPAELEALLEGLQTADETAASQIEGRIYEIWSQSGSPSMDLLLERGREALESGDTKMSIEHFSALIDHAPEFAEGYNGRATAHFQNGSFGLALNDIRRTLELNPRHFGAMTGLALILEEFGESEGALLAWREVERLNPNSEGLDDAIRRLEIQVGGETL